MKVSGVIAFVLTFFILVAFIRAVNDAGPLDVNNILLALDDFDFSFDHFKEAFSYYDLGAFSDTLVSWDPSLVDEAPIEGFFVNIGRVVGGFFTSVWKWISGFWRAVLAWFFDGLDLLVDIVNLFSAVLGFDVHIDYDFSDLISPSGHRGGR